MIEACKKSLNTGFDVDPLKAEKGCNWSFPRFDSEWRLISESYSVGGNDWPAKSFVLRSIHVVLLPNLPLTGSSRFVLWLQSPQTRTSSPASTFSPLSATSPLSEHKIYLSHPCISAIRKAAPILFMKTLSPTRKSLFLIFSFVCSHDRNTRNTNPTWPFDPYIAGHLVLNCDGDCG